MLCELCQEIVHRLILNLSRLQHNRVLADLHQSLRNPNRRQYREREGRYLRGSCTSGIGLCIFQVQGHWEGIQSSSDLILIRNYENGHQGTGGSFSKTTQARLSRYIRWNRHRNQERFPGESRCCHRITPGGQ